MPTIAFWEERYSGKSHIVDASVVRCKGFSSCFCGFHHISVLLRCGAATVTCKLVTFTDRGTELFPVHENFNKLLMEEITNLTSRGRFPDVLHN